MNGVGNRFFDIPDGAGYSTCQDLPDEGDAAILFTKTKWSWTVGESGSDPIAQSQCNYTAFYSADLVRAFPVNVCQRLIFSQPQPL